MFCCVILMLIPISFAGFNEEYNKDTQTQFLISEESIQVQQDETLIEQQRLSKEGEYLLKKSIKEEYLNEMWATYSSTIQMIVDLFIMIFLTAFIVLFSFITFELIPMGMNRLVDIIEGWLK